MATLLCPSCGYNLTGLPENRCPECGQAFDPAVLAAGAVMLAVARRRTFSRRDLNTIRLGWIIIAVVGLFAVPALPELALRVWETLRR